MKTIDNIWFERKNTLDKLYFDIKWILNSNMPLKRKHAIWQAKFDKFVLTSFDQDKQIRKLCKE